MRLLPTLRDDVTRRSQSDRMTLSVVCCDSMTLLQRHIVTTDDAENVICRLHVSPVQYSDC